MDEAFYKDKLARLYKLEHKGQADFSEVHVLTVNDKKYLVGVDRDFDAAYTEPRPTSYYPTEFRNNSTPHKYSCSRSYVAQISDDGKLFTGDSFLIEARAHDNCYATPPAMDTEHLENYYCPANTEISVVHNILSEKESSFRQTTANEYTAKIDAYYNVADREQLKAAVSTLSGSKDAKHPTNNDVIMLITEQLIKPTKNDAAFRSEENAKSLPAGKTAVLRAAVMAKGGSQRKSSFLEKTFHKRKKSIAKVVNNFYKNSR